VRHIDPTILDKFRQEEYTFAYLLELAAEDSKYFRFTNWDTPLTYGVEVYYPRAMEISPISYSTSSVVDVLGIRIDDVIQTEVESLYIALLGQGHIPLGAKLYLVILDDNYNIPTNGGTLFFQGNVDKWEYSPGEIDLQIASIFIQWNNVTTYKYSASCRWRKFGGAECKYPTPGDLVCDRTYKVCRDVYNNTENFGGFRWLPSLINKILIPERKKK